MTDNTTTVCLRSSALGIKTQILPTCTRVFTHFHQRNSAVVSLERDTAAAASSTECNAQHKV